MNSDIIDEIESYLAKFRKCEKAYIQIQNETVQEVEIAPGFNKSWCKLGLPEKLNRLMNYHAKIVQRSNMDQAKADVMRKYFYENVNSTLASDEYVTYDQTLGEVITIIGLKYDGVGFYIDDGKKQQTQTEGIRIKHMPIFNLEELNKKLKSQSVVLESSGRSEHSEKRAVSEHSEKKAVSEQKAETPLALKVQVSPMPASEGLKKKIAIRLKTSL